MNFFAAETQSRGEFFSSSQRLCGSNVLFPGFTQYLRQSLRGFFNLINNMRHETAPGNLRDYYIDMQATQETKIPDRLNRGVIIRYFLFLTHMRHNALMSSLHVHIQHRD